MPRSLLRSRKNSDLLTNTPGLRDILGMLICRFIPVIKKTLFNKSISERTSSKSAQLHVQPFIPLLSGLHNPAKAGLIDAESSLTCTLGCRSFQSLSPAARLSFCSSPTDVCPLEPPMLSAKVLALG